jgi:hypothetical protein
MTYASTSVDRRAEYYNRAAAVIAADPLDFYTRAEKGRKFQAEHFIDVRPVAVPAVVARCLDDARRRSDSQAAQANVLPFRRAAFQ